MAIIYNNNVKSDRMVVVRDAIDAAATPGQILIGTLNMAEVLSTITLADPCGVVSGLTLTLTTPVSDNSAAATGIAASAQVVDGDGVVIIDGLSVGTVGTDVILDNTSISVDQTVTINSAVFTHG